ncbi:MAG: glycosyltransferase family 9 protein [Rhodocyclaceae bacterium]
MPAPANPQQADKILVIKHGAFGDLVQADGALRDIRAAFPNAEIVLLTTPPFRRLMSRCPHVDRILSDARAPLWRLPEVFRLVRMLRNERFTRVFDLQKSGRSERYRKLLFRGLPWCGRQPGPRPPSMIEGFKPQLESAGITASHCLAPDVGWMADDVTAVLAAEGVRPGYIALIPGCAARHPYKRWPYYAELAAALIARGHQVVTAPGPDELELAKTIPGITLLGNNGFLNWFELAGVLKQARFVVGNDTGPSHVAACLGRPGLALFGPHTSAARTGIRRGAFDALEVADLATLPVETVLAVVLARLEDA